ncbi:hypothetical protein GEMRC1_012061 [Eukaryota sp. GEM-RC1]
MPPQKTSRVSANIPTLPFSVLVSVASWLLRSEYTKPDSIRCLPQDFYRVYSKVRSLFESFGYVSSRFFQSLHCAVRHFLSMESLVIDSDNLTVFDDFCHFFDTELQNVHVTLSLITSSSDFDHLKPSICSLNVKAPTSFDFIIPTSADFCPNLKHLAIFSITVFEMRSLVDALNTSTSIYSLNFTTIDLSTDHFHILKEYLENKSSLKCLSFIGTSLANDKLQYISESLTHNSSLKELRLSHNGINSMDAHLLADLLSTNESLCSLNLSYNNIASTGARYLSEALIVNSTLRCLDLGSNSIGDGVQVIAEALKANSTLASLSLYDNDIDSNGALCLAMSLQVNTSLRVLYLGLNMISSSGANHFVECLKINKCMGLLDLRCNNIDLELQNYMKELFSKRVIC